MTDNLGIYNSRIINTYVKFIKNKYTYIDIGELLHYAGMEPYQVNDEGHWFTQEQIDRFYDRLVKLSGNDNMAREAGRYGNSPDAVGVLRPYILGLVGPARAYELVGKWMPQFVRSATCQAKRIAPNIVEITVTPRAEHQERSFQCENRLGYFEAITMAFGHKMPKIEHPQCMFKGDAVCKYEISWTEVQSDSRKKYRNAATLLLATACLLSSLSYPAFTLMTLVPIAFCIILLLNMNVMSLEHDELLTALDHVRGSQDQLMEQIKVNYNNALVVNEIGLALSKQQSTTDILDKVVHILSNRLDYERGMIMLANDDKTQLIFRAGFGYQDEQINSLKDASFQLNKSSKGVFIRAFYDQKPFLINDIGEIAQTLSDRSLAFAKAMGTKAFCCCPIIYEEESIGVLAVDNVTTNRPLLQSDLNLLMGICPEIAIAMHNYSLNVARKKQFHDILATLAASIDARDFLTAGHSEKVTVFAMGICKEMNIPADMTETIRVASLLHDYGKIGIDDAILKKTGPLSPLEYKEIQTHAEKTMVILRRIGFEGLYKDVPEIAGAHHEKIDGSGYPRGLKGDEIPLGARIIAVADFFEAVTAKRHYREPIPFEKAVKLLEEQRDKHYDGEVTDAFLRYLRKEYEASLADRPVSTPDVYPGNK